VTGNVSLRFADLFAVFLYAVGILWLGWWTQKRIKGTEGFFLAGRSMPSWAVGMSVLATAISSITFLAYPGSSYTGNWSRLVPGLMLPFATAIGVYFFVVFYRRTMFVSAYEYFERRYGNWGRSYASALFSLGSLYRMGMVLYLMSLPIKVLTGWSGMTVIIFAGAIVTIYTVMGGLQGVIWTDVVQGTLLLVGGLVTIAIIFLEVPGGPAAVISQAYAAGKFNLVVSFDWTLARDTFWLFALMGLVGNIQEQATDQTKVQRYQAAKTDRDAIKAALYVLLCIPTWIMFMFIGSCLWVYYRAFPGILPEGIRADYVYPHFILTQTPPFIGGIIIVAVLSAAMATDSTMNGSASVILEDFYKRHFVKGKDDRHYLFVARLITWTLGALMMVVAWGFSLLNADTILDIGFFIGAIMAGGLGGFFLLGFLFKRANAQGALVGLLSGIAVILWLTLGHLGAIPERYAPDFHPFITGVLGNVVVFVVGLAASYFFPAPDQEKISGMTWWTREKTRDTRGVALTVNP